MLNALKLHAKNQHPGTLSDGFILLQSSVSPVLFVESRTKWIQFGWMCYNILHAAQIYYHAIQIFGPQEDCQKPHIYIRCRLDMQKILGNGLGIRKIEIKCLSWFFLICNILTHEHPWNMFHFVNISCFQVYNVSESCNIQRTYILTVNPSERLQFKLQLLPRKEIF